MIWNKRIQIRKNLTTSFKKISSHALTQSEGMTTYLLFTFQLLFFYTQQVFTFRSIIKNQLISLGAMLITILYQRRTLYHQQQIQTFQCML